MGRRGPSPKPLKLLEAGGSWLARHRTAEPQPPSGSPPRPDDLGVIALACWDRLAANLAALGLQGTTDYDTMRAYCLMWERYEKMSAVVRKKGEIVETDYGPKIRAEAHAANKLQAALAKMQMEFALTPGARARIGSSRGVVEKPKQDKKQGKARLISGA